MFEYLSGLIARGGVWAVFGLMLLENLVPLIPSELILPMVGYEGAKGAIGLGAAGAAGWIGSVAGAWVWYALARQLGAERTERLLDRGGDFVGISTGDVERALTWFRSRSILAVALGRSLPGVRSFICIPAGLTRMRFIPFALASAGGSLAWCVLLVASGVWLGARYDLVQRWLNPVLWGFFGISALGYVVKIVIQRRARR